MPTSNELIEELVSLTRDSLKAVETDLGELRADVRVLAERLNNQGATSTRIEGELGTVKMSTEESVKGLTQTQTEALGALKKDLLDALEATKVELKKDLAGYVKKNDAEVKRVDDRLQTLEKAHAKYLGAAAVAGAVLGFIASLAKGFLGL